jgi:ribosomal protein L11 methylase PrmA
MDAMLQKLSPKGRIILSGLLGADQPIIEEALNERNLKIISVLRENDWIAVATERR